MATSTIPNLNTVPFIVSIPTGQWSGSGSDYYITVNASNVTSDSILIPHFDKDSESKLNGPVWCVPGNASFTIHTSAIPTNTVEILVEFLGTKGQAQYQVLADVYSKSQTDSAIAESTASGVVATTRPTDADAVNNIADELANSSIHFMASGSYNGVVKDILGNAGGASWFVITYRYTSSLVHQWEFNYAAGTPHIYYRQRNNGTWSTPKTVV